MNKRAEFDARLAEAREMLRYRESLFPDNPDNPLLVEFRRQFDLAENIANGNKKHSKHLDEVDMANKAMREIEDMDPEFSDAISSLELSLCELLGVEI